MLRHEFQPGRLVVGLCLAVTGVLYAGDAGGLWDIPWFVVVPLVVGGLCLAGATAFLARSLRGRRAPVHEQKTTAGASPGGGIPG